MSWQDQSIILDNLNPDLQVIGALVAKLAVEESVTLVCRGDRLELRGWVAHMPHLVLTSRRLLISKDRLIGKPRIDRAVELSDVTGSGVGPLMGVGPTWEVSFATKGQGTGSLYFDSPPDAELFETTLRSATVLANPAAQDPDLVSFYRAEQLSREIPIGDKGTSLGPSELIDVSQQLRDAYNAGAYSDVFRQRAALGYGLSTEAMPQADRFWLNAAPALAALQIGLKDHPLTAACCGIAETDYSRSDPDQQSAIDEINRLYFG